MSACIDLRERFGRTYRISYDEAYEAEHGEHGRAEDAWLQIIPGRKGHVYPHGGDKLGVATNGRGPTAKRLLAVPGVFVVQEGSDGINATFAVEALPTVAEIVGLKRKRRLSPEARARLVAMGKASLARINRPHVGARENEREGVSKA